jgi:hypothetical protein
MFVNLILAMAHKRRIPKGVYHAEGYNQETGDRPRLRFHRNRRGKDLFFHESQLQGVDYPSLKEGQASSSGGGGY